MYLQGLRFLDWHLKFSNLISSINKLKCEDIFICFGVGFWLYSQEMELFLLIFSKIIKQFDIDGELLEGGGKDRIFTEIDSIFIHL